MKTFKSALSDREFPVTELVHGKAIRDSIFALIQREHPDLDRNASIAGSELNAYRERYISEYLSEQIGELSDLETNVLESLSDNTILSDKLQEDDEQQDFTLGQRVADKVASFGGSWTFIISFGVFLLIWIAVNAIVLSDRGFDPYPFILLNLILSCLAAMQAPVIMMSQNRQEEKDRDRAKKDYMINLKSELEIRMLHEKIDHLIMHQQRELLEIQKVQIEMMNDIFARIGDGKKE
jgi:uncharacterized membrane protein